MKKSKKKAKSNYIPDLDSKYLLKGLKSKTFLSILDVFFKNQIDINSVVEFTDTESSEVTGYEDKTFVRSDLIAKLNDDKKVIIEFQTTPNKFMGYKIFIYSLNNSKKVIGNEGEVICDMPKCLTIYTTLNDPIQNIEKVKIQKHKYKCVGLFEFEVDETDEYVELEFPAINILALTAEQLDELDGTPLEIFKILYLYKYQKNNEMLLKDDVPKLLIDIEDIVSKYDGKDNDVLTNLFIKLKEDTKNILKLKSKENTEYGKVLDKVINLQDYPELASFLKMKADIRAEGKAEGIAETTTKVTAEVTAKYEKEKQEYKNKIAELTAELEKMGRNLDHL